MDENWKFQIDLIINQIDISKYSAEQIINSIEEIIHSNEEYENSINDKNEETQTNSTDSSITDQICFYIYDNNIEVENSFFLLTDENENKKMLLIYVIHKLGFDLKNTNIIDFLKNRINDCNSKECFLALTTQIDYSSEKDKLFESLMKFLLNNNNIDEDIWKNLLKMFKNFEDKASEFKNLIEQIIKFNEINPKISKEFVNIINYLISKKPKIFINDTLINFIMEKLKKYDEHILSVFVTIFEYYNDDWTKLEKLLSVFMENSSYFNEIEEIDAVLIIFLNKKSIALNKVFDDEHLNKLFASFEKENSHPDSPKFRRIVKAAICICNYYYQQTSKFKTILEKQTSKFKTILEKAFPFENKQQNKVNVQESSGDSETYLYLMCNNIDEQNLNESEQCSSGNSLNQNNNGSFLEIESDSSVSSLDFFYPDKENPDDIYDYVKSNLNEEPKKRILAYNTIKSVLKEKTDETKLINILKLWSLCVLRADEEKQLFESLIYNTIKELYKSHQKEIEKLLIFKARPIALKSEHYVTMNDFIKENKNNLKEQFGLIQNNFNFIFNDYEQLKSSKEDIENKGIIVLFCSLRIDDSNTQSLNGAIEFFRDEYRKNNGGTKLFIKNIISHYIQNWLQKETNNKCNSNLCKLLWEFLDLRKLGPKKFRVFPEMLEKTIHKNRPIYFYLYLLKSFMELPKRPIITCLDKSKKILINTTKMYEDYKKEINQFFKQVKRSHS